MSKFLLILLIAVVASTEVQHLELRKLNSPDALIHYLRSNGLYDFLSNIARKYGKPKAIDMCISKVPIQLKRFCNQVVNSM